MGQICCFSGIKIYPGHGILYVHSKGKCCIFSNSKTRRLYFQIKKNDPRKIAWTMAHRKAHKKNQSDSILKKKKNTHYKGYIKILCHCYIGGNSKKNEMILIYQEGPIRRQSLQQSKKER